MNPFKIRYKARKNSFYKILPWAYISDYAEGVVVQKNGLLQRTFVFRGPDLESASALYINDMSLFINDIIRSLGTGWAFQFETDHFETKDYQGTVFTNTAAFLIDKEREETYQSFGSHYDTSYYLTIIYEAPIDISNKVTNIFFKEKSIGFDTSIKEAIEKLLNITDDIYALLSKKITIVPLNNDETLAFLKASISKEKYPIRNTDIFIPFFLDHVLPDQKLEIGMTLKLGDYFIPMITINAFPSQTYPAILDALNAARIEYRWVSRFICMDKQTALASIQKQSDKYFGQRESWKQTFFKMWTNEDTGRINKAAVAREEETDAAQIDIETDEVSLGYYTSSLMVWDTSLKKAKEKLTVLKSIIGASGFTCVEETFNALECFMAMMPGNVYPNIRRTALTSMNFAHVIPLSAIWAGDDYNAHTDTVCNVGVPLMTCSSNYGTPFYFNLNVGDVGMAFIVGPIGSGKSTLLQLIEAQFLKYTGSRVIILDKGRSARQLTMAVGGRYYEPGTERIAFQPLAAVDTQEDCLFASEFIEGLLIMQHLTITPAISKAVYEAVQLVSGMPKEQRTMTTFRQTVNYYDEKRNLDAIKEALQPYCLGGKYGHIFDADSTNMNIDSNWLMIEMGALMKLGEACVTPALKYIFHLIESTFDGTLTLLVLDEAILFFKNEVFADQFKEWIKTVRKLNVMIVFATQEIADIVHSPLASTITEECLTKIFLANQEAGVPAIADYYRQLGLTDSQIDIISHAVMKKDYFYKSPRGTRLFQLDLGKLTLALIGSQDHVMLDELEKKHIHEPGYEYVYDILDVKNIEYKHYLEGFE